ncbi:MAG: winged helix-turn-helix domain-containing protein [Gammaproteobacteria bacterium]|nr:winged helix-turn-helix domain-containing protein [Gammaproteobacteria bacterium]
MSKIQFDDYTLDTAKPALYRDGVAVDIPSQPLRLLVLLASRNGDVVSHSEICKYLWGSQIVDFSNGLYVCVRQIRSALEDTAERSRYIQNVPRRGYRFLGDTAVVADRPPIPDVPKFPRHSFRWTAAAILLLAIGSLVLVEFPGGGADGPTSSAFNMADDAYVRGRYVLESKAPDAIERSRQFFRSAIEADPTHAPSYAAMAETYQLGGDLDRARPYAVTALRLDDSLAEAHLRMAAVTALADWDWRDAEQSARTALALAPDSAEAHQAMATIYSVTGRMELALREMRSALALDPVSTLLRADYGTYLYYRGDLDGAKLQCSDALHLDPSHYPSQLCLYKVAVRAGEYAEAAHFATGIAELWGRQRPATQVPVISPTRPGIDAFEQWRLTRYRETGNANVSPLAYALALAALGRHDEALDHLEQSVRIRETMTPFVLADPVFEAMREGQRFKSVLRATNVRL